MSVYRVDELAAPAREAAFTPAEIRIAILAGHAAAVLLAFVALHAR